VNLPYIFLNQEKTVERSILIVRTTRSSRLASNAGAKTDLVAETQADQFASAFSYVLNEAAHGRKANRC
jgi:hypothetical protein